MKNKLERVKNYDYHFAKTSINPVGGEGYHLTDLQGECCMHIYILLLSVEFKWWLERIRNN